MFTSRDLRTIKVMVHNICGVKQMNLLWKIVKCESAVTAIEYGLIASLISIVIVVALALVGANLTGIFNSVAAKL